MVLFALDINQIAVLGTQVATSGALRSVELAADELFEFVIAIVILIYEVSP